MTNKRLRLLDQCSTEALKEVFELNNLNCFLGEHLLRMIAYELCRRGEPQEKYRSYIIGPDECKHGRSVSGTCGECDVEDMLATHPWLNLYVILEKKMLEFNEKDENLADRIRDLMDPIWHNLDEEEREFLNSRA